MCGIFALITDEPTPDVFQWTNEGSKRGPDGTTFYKDNHWGDCEKEQIVLARHANIRDQKPPQETATKKAEIPLFK
jgi:asparagine synthetase B (glutamine-hydrolysing)